MQTKRCRLLFLLVFVLPFIFLSQAPASETLALPEDLLVIEDEAFMGDTSLEAVILPENVQKIGSRAFADSTITAIWLPASLSYIADDAFDGCKNLSVTAPEGSYAHSWAQNAGLIPSPTQTPPGDGSVSGTADGVSWQLKDGILLIAGNGPVRDYTIPTKGDVPPWYEHRFDITALVVEEGITALGNYSFCYLEALVSVSLPSSLKTLGTGVFYNCSALPSVTLPSGLTAMGMSVFQKCVSLARVDIPNTVKTIGQQTFRNCTSLKSVVLPDGLTVIDKWLFNECTALESVTIPAGVHTIDFWAFEHCTSLKTVTLPYGVTTLGECAFQHCDSLTVIQIPPTVTSIGNSAFAACPKIHMYISGESFILDYARQHYYRYTPADPWVDYTYTANGDGTCTITGYIGVGHDKCLIVPGTAPDGSRVTAIGENVFKNVLNQTHFWLTKVILPEGLLRIGDGAFENQATLEYADLPSGLTIIGSNAFSGCDLKKVTLPASLRTIGVRAFMNNHNLSAINLHSGITSLGGYAFMYCYSLKSVYIPASIGSIPNGAFSWAKGLTQVEIAPGITSIGSSAFGCTNLSTIIIPDSVCEIANLAFESCTNTVFYCSSGSYAETWGRKKNFVCTDITPPFIDVPETDAQAIPEEYYRILYTYTVNGRVYHEAELTQEYMGVYQTCGEQTFFFMDDDKRPVQNLELIKKLWTIHMFVRSYDSILVSSADTLASVTPHYASIMAKFLDTEMLMQTLGSLAEGALKAALTGGASLWGDVLDILDKTVTSDNVFMVTEIMLAQHFSDGALKAANAFRVADVTGGTGMYDYQLVMDALSLYKSVYMLNQVVEGMCMPIVDEVLSEYSSDFEYAVGNLAKVAGAFFKAAAEDVIFAGVDAFFRNWKSIDSAKTLLTKTVEILKSDLPVTSAQWYNAVKTFAALNETLGKITGVTDEKANSFLAPLFLDQQDPAFLQLYEAQLELGK